MHFGSLWFYNFYFRAFKGNYNSYLLPNTEIASIKWYSTIHPKCNEMFKDQRDYSSSSSFAYESLLKIYSFMIDVLKCNTASSCFRKSNRNCPGFPKREQIGITIIRLQNNSLKCHEVNEVFTWKKAHNIKLHIETCMMTILSKRMFVLHCYIAEFSTLETVAFMILLI